MFDLKRGDVVQMTSMTVRPNEDSSFTFRAPRGKQFVLLLLGVEDKKDAGQKLDCIEVIEQMGWTNKEPEDRAALKQQHKQVGEANLLKRDQA
jgi:hypothetical protein